MILHKTLKRGSDHPIFCQDALAIGETDKCLYFCVFDGCSGGITIPPPCPSLDLGKSDYLKDSHFASALFSKAFNDTIKNLASTLNSADMNLESNSKFIIYMMTKKINEVKRILNLNIGELLATMIMCSIDKTTKECFICVFGDGYFSVNGNETIVKNTKFADKENGSNMPDYIAYDLKDIEAYGDFEVWFSKKSEIHKFENVNEVTIASDGICTFKSFKECDNSINPIEYLVKDNSLIETANMLDRKYNILKNIYYMTNTDDISIVRVKLD